MKTAKRVTIKVEMPELGLRKAQLASLRNAFKESVVHTLSGMGTIVVRIQHQYKAMPAPK